MYRWLLHMGIYLLIPISSSALNASIQVLRFKHPGQGNVLELNLHVVGHTLQFDTLGHDSLQAQVQVLILVKKSDQCIRAEKALLLSPISPFPIDIVHQWRFVLPQGNMELEVQLTDPHQPDRVFTIHRPLKYAFHQVPSQSDIQLLQAFFPTDSTGPFVKNGFYLQPLPFNLYHKQCDRLIFYNELYDTDSLPDTTFVLTWRINYITDKGHVTPVMIGHKKKGPAPIVPILMQADIRQLPSGNYLLEVEVRDAHKTLLSQKSVRFHRTNPYLNISREALAQMSLNSEFVATLDSAQLHYSLRAIAPLINDSDGQLLNKLLKSGDIAAQRLFLFHYWTQQNPNHPQQAYQSFMAIARAVDRKFRSGFGYGFETDRGYVFLKYGAPDDIITVEDEPDAPPYEIWSYNYLPRTGQTNVKFLFYNPSLASGDFKLLHSTVRGEVNNPRWEVMLYRNNPNELEGTNFVDGTIMQDKMGRRARRLMNDF